MFAPDSAGVVPEPGRADAPATPGDLAGRLPRSVGATPLVPLRSIALSDGARFQLWGKLEAANPSGSVKDRAALAIVRAALSDGRLGGGRTLVDASSGNTGLAYATLGARVGFPVLLFIPRNAHPSRLSAIRALQAEVVLTDPAEGTDGARREAIARVTEDPGRYFFADQYHNPANPAAHYATTGPEIWRQSHGAVTHLVAGVGTGGTISGAGRFLKERRPSLRVVAVEPTGPIHGLEGLKHLPTADVPSTYDARVPDVTLRVETEEAQAMVTRLERTEGLHVGPSAGAAVVAALRTGAQAPGSFVVAILPDGGHAAAAEER